MRPIRWLHISDLHLRESEVWSQDAVLAAMLDDIRHRVTRGAKPDFVLVTGDLAYSGQEIQYTLVKAFVDDLVTATDLTRDKIFCVPGNHDVDRGRQTMCFAGARNKLQNESDIYSFASSEEERHTLLVRQHNFMEFQERYFPTQVRNWTDDGLGYVSLVEVDDIKIAIIGLNSAWLAQGGVSDHGQLLLGECQVINAIKIARQSNPHVVIGITHHPFTLLNEFDRLATQHRLEEACHFFHCGHLHVPDATNIATHSGRCLTLVAGASYEARTAQNAYTIVDFDALYANTDITFIHYDATTGVFSLESNKSYPHQIDAATTCDIGELADALRTYCPAVADFSYYFAALLVERFADVPIPTDSGIILGTVSFLRQQPESELKVATFDFFTVSNAVKLLSGHQSLKEILAVNGEPVVRYGSALLKLSETNASIRAQLAQRNDSARMLANASTVMSFSHTLTLLEELRDSGEWDTLRQQAERYIWLEDPSAATHVKRLLALCLIRSTERVDRDRATNLYQELADSPHREAADLASLATLLTEDGNHDQATTTVLGGIEAFPENADGFVEIGMKIVEATGNLNLRKQLMTHREKRRVE